MMRSDSAPGGTPPDYKLPDHNTVIRPDWDLSAAGVG
jgi:hypothetical protein